MKRTAVFLQFILTGLSFTQTFDFVHVHPVEGIYVPELSTSIDLDSQNRPVIARMISNDLNYGAAFGNFILEKRDLSGTQLWCDTLSGFVDLQGILVDRNDDIYTYGRFRDSLDVSGLDYPLSNDSETHAWVAKFNTVGELMWINNYSFSNPDLSSFTAMCEGSDGIWLASDMGFHSSIIHQLSAGGTLTTAIEHENVGGVFSLSADGYGGLWVSGATSMGPQSFNGYEAEAPFNYNQYIVRYDYAGSARWVTFIEDVTAEPSQIIADQDGFAYFGSPLHDDFLFGDIQSQGPDWVFDFALARLDSNGNFLWLREVPLDDQLGDAGTGTGLFLDVGPDNSVYFTGFSRNSINWGHNIITQGDLYYDALVLNYDSEGEILWGKTAGGEGYERGGAIVVDSEGAIWVAGRCGETANFDALTLTGSITNTFVSRLSMTPTSIQLSQPSLLPQMVLEANYPNPFNPSTQISFTLRQNSAVNLKVYDISGSEVATLVNAQKGPGSHSVIFESHVLPAGVYIYQLSTQLGVLSRKMLLVK